MNTKKISFTVNGQTKGFEVQDCYPYLINPSTNKVVLRLSVKEEDASYEDIYSLKNCTGIIEQFERTIDGEIVGEWEKVNTLEDYNSGEISIGYNNGMYSADLTRVGKYERMVEQNAADIQYISIMADIPLE